MVVIHIFEGDVACWSWWIETMDWSDSVGCIVTIVNYWLHIVKLLQESLVRRNQLYLLISDSFILSKEVQQLILILWFMKWENTNWGFRHLFEYALCSSIYSSVILMTHRRVLESISMSSTTKIRTVSPGLTTNGFSFQWKVRVWKEVEDKVHTRMRERPTSCSSTSSVPWWIFRIWTFLWDWKMMGSHYGSKEWIMKRYTFELRILYHDSLFVVFMLFISVLVYSRKSL